MNVRAIILAEYRRQRAIPFAWGTADCLCFAASVAHAITGRDPIAHLRGRYDSAIGAGRVMVEEGWVDLAALASSLFPEVAIGTARSGDWARVIDADGRETLGVVIGAQVVARAQSGVGFVGLLAADRAWSVGWRTPLDIAA